MSGTAEVNAALKARLLASDGAALASASVAWEGKPFTEKVGTRYYRVTFIPGEPTAAGIGSEARNRHVGVFFVTVFDPAGNEVKTKVEAERIVAAFKRGTVLSYSGVSVRINKAYAGQGNAETEWYSIPVKITWQADVEN